jgi:hypothetical protein
MKANKHEADNNKKLLKSIIAGKVKAEDLEKKDNPEHTGFWFLPEKPEDIITLN